MTFKDRLNILRRRLRSDKTVIPTTSSSAAQTTTVSPVQPTTTQAANVITPNTVQISVNASSAAAPGIATAATNNEPIPEVRQDPRLRESFNRCKTLLRCLESAADLLSGIDSWVPLIGAIIKEVHKALVLVESSHAVRDLAMIYVSLPILCLGHDPWLM